MGDDTINNGNNGLGDGDSGTIQGGGQDPINTPPDNPPFPDPTPTPTPDPAPAASDGDEDEFLKYVKMANDLCWIPGILKAYGADKQLQFGKIEEEEYVEDEETCKLIHPNVYDDKQQVPDDVLAEDLFSIEACRDESAALDSPLNGEDELLDEDTFNYPSNFEDTITPWYTREISDGSGADGDKIREMLMKLLPSEDVDGAVKDPEWTFGKFMKEKFPSYVASDKAAKFLDLVAQYSVVDAVERLAVQEAKEEVLAAATGDEDQDELLALVQEAAEEKRKQYLTDYVLPPAEGDPAKYRKFWKDVLEIIKAL